MIMSNKFLAICLGLIGLAAICCYAAELPPTLAPAGTAASTSTTPAKPADQLTAIEGDEEDDEMWLMGDAEDEDEELEDEEDYLEEMDSPEEELAELSEEHFEVKRDCAELAGMIQKAKNNKTAVDQGLQEAYDDCQQDLKDIEADMQTLSAEIEDEE